MKIPHIPPFYIIVGHSTSPEVEYAIVVKGPHTDKDWLTTTFKEKYPLHDTVTIEGGSHVPVGNVSKVLCEWLVTKGYSQLEALQMCINIWGSLKQIMSGHPASPSMN